MALRMSVGASPSPSLPRFSLASGLGSKVAEDGIGDRSVGCPLGRLTDWLVAVRAVRDQSSVLFITVFVHYRRLISAERTAKSLPAQGGGQCVRAR